MENGKSDFGAGLFVAVRAAYDAAVALNPAILPNHFAKKFRP